jgi:DNA-binding LacI/PurR family transcriptional regulator
MSTATIRDVAKKAQVGVGTVSRVLNDHPSVSPETKEKVLAAIEQLDYVPNPVAQRLSRGRTHTISVVLPYLTIPSFVERLRGVQNILDYSEYDLVLYSAENPDRRDHLLNTLPRKARTDGIIIVSICPDKEQVERFQDSNTPVVLVDVFHKDLPSVYVDNVQGGWMATKHLLDLGHKKIAFISDFLINDFRFSAMQERYSGYQQALIEAKIAFNANYHREVPHDRDLAKEAALELLQLSDPPTAIFASSDIQGIGVLAAAREMNLKVPEELSVIGFDGVRDSEYVQLTTIKQPLFDSGVRGTEVLLKAIEDQTFEVQQFQLELTLITRESTDKLS